MKKIKLRWLVLAFAFFVPLAVLADNFFPGGPRIKGVRDSQALRVASRAMELSDVSCAADQACDTGVLDTSGFSNLFCNIANGGATAAGNCTLKAVRDDGSTIQVGNTIAPPLGSASQACSWGPNGANGGANVAVPRRVQVSCTAVVGATIRITVVGR